MSKHEFRSRLFLGGRVDALFAPACSEGTLGCTIHAAAGARFTATAAAGGRLPLQPAPACPDVDLSAAGDAPSAQQLAGYAPVVKCPSGQWPPSYDQADGSWDSGRRGSGGNGLRPLLRQLAARLPGGAAVRLERLLGLQAVAPPGVPLAWHPQQPLLAAVDSCGRVQVFDYAGQVPSLAQGAGGSAPPPLQPALVLQHDLQQSPGAAAWRPYGGRCLAVGSRHGVCLWHLCRPPAGSGSRQAGAASRGLMPCMLCPAAVLHSDIQGAQPASAVHPRATLAPAADAWRCLPGPSPPSSAAQPANPAAGLTAARG